MPRRLRNPSDGPMATKRETPGETHTFPTRCDHKYYGRLRLITRVEESRWWDRLPNNFSKTNNYFRLPLATVDAPCKSRPRGCVYSLHDRCDECDLGIHCRPSILVGGGRLQAIVTVHLIDQGYQWSFLTGDFEVARLVVRRLDSYMVGGYCLGLRYIKLPCWLGGSSSTCECS